MDASVTTSVQAEAAAAVIRGGARILNGKVIGSRGVRGFSKFGIYRDGTKGEREKVIWAEGGRALAVRPPAAPAGLGPGSGHQGVSDSNL